MRPRYDYTALRNIPIRGGAYGFAYREGDDMTAAAYEGLQGQGYGLVVGRDVQPARPDVVPRPAEAAPAGEWRAYAVGQGLDVDEADELSKTELVEKYPAQPPEGGAVPLRPAKSATKGDWVDWVVAAGLAEREAADAETKDALIERFGGPAGG